MEAESSGVSESEDSAECKSDVLSCSVRRADGRVCVYRPLTTHTKELLHETRVQHVEKLGSLELLEGRGADREEAPRMKVKILHSYVNDLCDQNQALVRTVGDLEKEANDKLAFLQAKIDSSDQTIKVSAVKLSAASPEEIAEPSGSSKQPCTPEDTLKAYVNNLRPQLKAEDGIIPNLREEIKKSLLESVQSKSEASGRDDNVVELQSKWKPLHNVQWEEASQITAGDIRIRKQRAELQLLYEMKKRKELQEMVKKLKGEMVTKEVQSEASNRELKEKVAVLTAELQKSEAKANSLDLEVCLLKSKLQEKTEQSQQLQDQIVKQQEALSRASETLRDTKKAAGSKISKRENKLGLVQGKLLEVQKQHSECRNELLLRENLLQKLKEETVQLTARMKEQSQDVNKLSGEKKKLELEMTVVMEKHRAAQQEVSSRDQVILQLRTTLKTVEEKLQAAQGELPHGIDSEKNKDQLYSTLPEETAELLRRKTSEVKEAQKELSDIKAVAKGHEMAAAIFKGKYQAAMEKVRQLEGRMEGLEEEVRYSKSQVCQAHAKVDGLKAEIVNLEGRYDEKCSLTECSAEAIEQLTEELESTQNALEVSRDRVAECEQLTGRLREQLLEREKAFLGLRSDFTSYQLDYSHSNEAYEALQHQRGLLRKDLESLWWQYSKQAAKAARLERGFQDLKADTAGLGEELRKYEDENRNLQHTLQSLHLDAASAHQDHKVALARLEQEVAQLEADLTDSRRSCALKDQALRARDDLLKRCEAELVRVRETAGREALQQRCLERIAGELRREALAWEANQSQRKRDNLPPQLQELYRWHKETGHALAARGEQPSALDGGLGTAQEQPGKPAEAMPRQRSSRQACAELRSTNTAWEERVYDNQEELGRVWQMAEKLQADVPLGKQLLMQAQQEVLVERCKANNQALTVTRQGQRCGLQILAPTAQLERLQRAHQESIKDLVDKEEQCVAATTKSGAPREKSGCENEEVESLQMERCVFREKLEAVRGELETQRQASGAACEETAHLQHHSQWLAASPSTRVEEQSHPQETKDAMEVELQKLRAESNEKEKEIEHLKLSALSQENVDQRELLEEEQAQHKQPELRLRSSDRGHPFLRAPPCQPAPPPCEVRSPPTCPPPRIYASLFDEGPPGPQNGNRQAP